MGLWVFVRDVFLVLGTVLTVDHGRRRKGPGPLLAELRDRGARGPVRTLQERARLTKIIRVIDRCFPGGGNCYRRALLEIAVDPTAADSPLNLALRSGGGLRSGHAWLGSSSEPQTRYDAEFFV
jgi:hypothetical protein